MDKPLRYYELHAEVCKTFGHPKRLMVITTLRENELTVTEIAEQTKIDDSNLSQHLHLLRDKGIVTTRREGTKIFYRLSHPNIGKALDLMSSFLEQRITSSHDLIKEA
jgi:DNA-binding transcriptional ArsR family regulator